MDDKQIEVAAKQLCKLRGIEPEAAQPDVRNTSMAYITVPAWRNAEVEVRNHVQLSEAVQYGRIMG